MGYTVGKGHGLNAEELGWRASDGIITQAETDEKPVPEYFMLAIYCNCMTYFTLDMQLHKNGFECPSSACGECRGFLYTNITFHRE